jgi:hypothetical protein
MEAPLRFFSAEEIHTALDSGGSLSSALDPGDLLAQIGAQPGFQDVTLADGLGHEEFVKFTM